MSETRTGLRTESQLVVRLTAGALLDEGLSGLEDPTYRNSPEYPDKTYLTSRKGFSISKHPDKYEIDEVIRFRDGVRGLSDNGTASFDLINHLQPVRSGGQEGPIVGARLGLDLSPWRTREVMLASPLFGPRYGDDKLTARSALSVLAMARELNYLPLFYRIERPTDDMEQAFDRLRAVLKSGAVVTELLIIPDTAEGRSEDHFSDHPGPERTGHLIDDLVLSNPKLLPPNPIDIQSKRDSSGTVKSAS